MKPRIILSILVLFFFASVAMRTTFAYTELDGGPVSLRGEGTRPLTPGPTLDDFNNTNNIDPVKGTGINVWGAGTGGFSSEDPAPADAICKTSFTNDPLLRYGTSGYSLKLDYNVTKVTDPPCFAGYYSKLGGVSIGSYTAIAFKVRGAAGGEFFKIELRTNNADKDQNHGAVYITDYLDGGVTTSWQTVTIPLHNFASISDWTQAKEFVIVFENYQLGVNGSAKQGTIYIDDIIFTSSAVSAVRIDHFGDKVGICALGGIMGDMFDPGFSSSSHTFSNAAGTYYNIPYGFSSTYDVRFGWAGHFFIVGGGDDGETARPHDFSAYNYLTLYVKAKSATENPKMINIELEDNSGKRTEPLYTITTDWKQFKIPLTNFVGLNKSTIKQINFVYVPQDIEAVGGNKQGTIYIDGLQFDQN